MVNILQLACAAREVAKCLLGERASRPRRMLKWPTGVAQSWVVDVDVDVNVDVNVNVEVG